MHKTRTELTKNLLPPFFAFIIVFGLWEIVDYLFDIKEVILPTPTEIITTFANHHQEIMQNALITLTEAVSGFIIGSIIGIGIAIIFTYSKLLRKSLLPYLVAFSVMPAYALAPLLILWFGNDLMPKIVLAAIVTTFPVSINAVKGLQSPDQDQINLFKSMGASKWNIFLHLRLPRSLPHIFPGFRLGAMMSIISATVAEFMGSSKGIGHLIITASYYIDTSLMFAAIVSISILGVVFFYSIQAIEKRVLFWQTDN